MRGDGRIFPRHRAADCPNRGKPEDEATAKCSCPWWVAYYRAGKEIRESAGNSEKKAKDLLKKRRAEIYGGTYIGPDEEKVTVSELLDSLGEHLKNKGARGKSHKAAIDRARKHFGDVRALDLRPDRMERFIAEEKAEKNPRAPATINRAIQVLKQAYRLALKDSRLSRIPGRFPMLKEENARQGFFEHEEFQAVKVELSVAYADAAEFAYLSAWRKGEILPLRWDAVDRAVGEIRLKSSKNGRGRMIPLEGELRDLVERRWVAREYADKDDVTRISPFVFHADGQPVGDFRKAWATACKKAGYPGKLFHDLRRTAVRNMIRAGVPQSVAMSISGHRTISMFLRYNITSDADQREALRRVEQHLAERPKRVNVSNIRPK
jgi:integrase